MSRETISVAICTFRRDVRATLTSLATQKLPDGVSISVFVADNDESDERRASIEADARNLALDLRYVHAPRQNISIARNACLDACATRWLAFIDDDEVARPEWLARLLAYRLRHDFVFGLVRAQYADPDTSSWMREGDFHSTKIEPNDPPSKGYSGNALIDLDFVRAHDLRFAIALGQTGGEDTLFFHEAFGKGARLGYAADAIVDEAVPSARANWRWLARRRFRSGQVHAYVQRRDGQAIRATIKAAAKTVVLLGAAALTMIRPGISRRLALRAMLHAGVVASGLGAAIYREYRS